MTSTKRITWINLLRSLCLVVASTWSLILWAESVDLSPTQVVQTAVSDVLTYLRSNEAVYENEPGRITDLINQKVVPYFDFSRMTQLAMTTSWNTASEVDRTAVTEAFQELFVATYGKQLFAYRNTQAEIEAMPGATDQKASLKMKAHNLRGDNVTLFLRLEKKTDRWKVIDINVDGVSYVVTSRGQFSEAITNKGIDGLIQYLHEAKQNIK